MIGRILAVAGAVGAAAVGVVMARGRRSAAANADLWSQATRSLAERDLQPPSTVSVNSARSGGVNGVAGSADQPPTDGTGR